MYYKIKKKIVLIMYIIVNLGPNQITEVEKAKLIIKCNNGCLLSFDPIIKTTSDLDSMIQIKINL